MSNGFGTVVLAMLELVIYLLFIAAAKHLDKTDTFGDFLFLLFGLAFMVVGAVLAVKIGMLIFV